MRLNGILTDYPVFIQERVKIIHTSDPDFRLDLAGSANTPSWYSIYLRIILGTHRDKRYTPAASVNEMSILGLGIPIQLLETVVLLAILQYFIPGECNPHTFPALFPTCMGMPLQGYWDGRLTVHIALCVCDDHHFILEWIYLNESVLLCICPFIFDIMLWNPQRGTYYWIPYTRPGEWSSHMLPPYR